MVGQVLGDRYRLEERIGEGGMSVVWRGTDVVLVRQVAVKILAGPLGARQRYRGTIRTDATAAASLSHPNVAAVFDYGEYMTVSGELIPYVVMELLRGRSLSQWLRDGPLEPAVALRICAQVAGALAAAHANGLVHLDVKPGNVVLAPGGAKVIDFGLAAIVGQFGDVDPDAPILGTAAYLAPERLDGASVNTASDVYALGLLLFRALTNKLPWPAETVTEMITAHVYAEPGPLPDLPGISAAVRELVVQCLAKKPQDRPSARTAAIVLAEGARIEPPLAEEQRRVAVTPYPPGAGSTAPDSGGLNRVRGDRAASTEARPDPDVTPTVTRTPRRIPAMMAAAAAILVAGVLVTALVTRTTMGTNSEAGLPKPGAEATELVHSPQPEATTPATDTATPHADPTTPPVTPPAGTPGAIGDPPTTTSAPSMSTSRTFETAGGTLVAACQAALAVLTSWAPMPTYTVKNVEAGPATIARITFQSTSERVATVTRISCETGTPVASTNDGPADLKE